MALSTHERSKSNGTNDWITPKPIIDALGPFDMDPCASKTQPWPTADVMISPPQDGLSIEWSGLTWMNPPYGTKVGEWTSRMSEHNNGVTLIFARVDTRWFWSDIWSTARAIYFMKGRIKFHYPDGRMAKGNSGGPSCLVAYGDMALDRLRGFDLLPGVLLEEWTLEAQCQGK